MDQGLGKVVDHGRVVEVHVRHAHIRPRRFLEVPNPSLEPLANQLVHLLH